MKKTLISAFILTGLLTACANPLSAASNQVLPASTGSSESLSRTAATDVPPKDITSATATDVLPKDRTSVFEALPENINAQTVIKIPAEAELGYLIMDPSVVYERFPEIVTAEILSIGTGRNYSETKKMHTMTFSPITIKVEQVWKGLYFKEGEKISLFANGGYFPYREMEKSFHPDDAKAQETKRTMSQKEKDSTWYFEEFDGRSFPEVGKKYLLHVHRDEFNEYYISGWGLGIQEIDPTSNTLPSNQTVAEYMKKLQ